MALVTGPWIEPLAVPARPGDRVAGIRLQPGAAFPVLGVRPDSLVNRTLPALGILGPFTEDLVAVVTPVADLDAIVPALDQLFLAILPGLAAPDPMVFAAAELMKRAKGEAAINQMANDLHTSQRTLLRRFKRATGLTPKQFSRIHRLLAAAWRVVDGMSQWAEIAAAAGYADQPHLHHEFVGLTGLTPGAFKGRTSTTEHDGVRR